MVLVFGTEYLHEKDFTKVFLTIKKIVKEETQFLLLGRLGVEEMLTNNIYNEFKDENKNATFIGMCFNDVSFAKKHRQMWLQQMCNILLNYKFTEKTFENKLIFYGDVLKLTDKIYFFDNGNKNNDVYFLKALAKARKKPFESVDVLFSEKEKGVFNAVGVENEFVDLSDKSFKQTTSGLLRNLRQIIK